MTQAHLDCRSPLEQFYLLTQKLAAYLYVFSSEEVHCLHRRTDHDEQFQSTKNWF